MKRQVNSSGWRYGCGHPAMRHVHHHGATCALDGQLPLADADPMSDTKHPQHFRAMEGKAYQLGPLKLAFKRKEADVEGSYSMFESLEQPGRSVALHRHPTFQETFIVLEGRFEFEVAGERRSLGQGECSSFREEPLTDSCARRQRPAAC